MKFRERKGRYKKPEESISNSFLAAIEGLRYSFFEERNMVVIFFSLALVIVAGVFFNISELEWLAIALVSGSIIALELLNTAIEIIVDMIDLKFNPLAKKAKDASAASVLVMTVVSVVIAIIIFVPKLMEMII